MENKLTAKEVQSLTRLEGLEEMMVDGIDLIPVYVSDAGERVVDGRELHQGVQSRQAFSDWIKKRLLECDAIENMDFCSFHKIMEREIGASTRTEYIIKLDTAKEMAMLERNEIGKKVRKYFIAVENKAKETAIQAQRLSPMLQVMINLELEQKQQAEKLAALEEIAGKHEENVRFVADALLSAGEEEEFKQWVKKALNSIAESPRFTRLCGNKFQEARSESYKRLTDKAHCNLPILVKNAIARAEERGAAKTQINAINRLSVIAADRRLKEIYMSVIREMMIAYCVDI